MLHYFRASLYTKTMQLTPEKLNVPFSTCRSLTKGVPFQREDLTISGRATSDSLLSQRENFCFSLELSMLNFSSRRSKVALRRTSSCSSLLNKHPQHEEQSIFNMCFPMSKSGTGKSEIYRKGHKYSVPIVIFQPVPEGVEHISQLTTTQCQFCLENSEKVHRDCMRLNIVSRGLHFYFLQFLTKWILKKWFHHKPTFSNSFCVLKNVVYP